MTTLTSSLTGLLFFTSLTIIALIFPQNETTKEIATKQVGIGFTPLEKVTFLGIILQFTLLLIKIKSNTF